MTAFATIYDCFLLIFIKKYSKVEFSFILPQFLNLILAFEKNFCDPVLHLTCINWYKS